MKMMHYLWQTQKGKYGNFGKIAKESENNRLSTNPIETECMIVSKIRKTNWRCRNQLGLENVIPISLWVTRNDIQLKKPGGHDVRNVVMIATKNEENSVYKFI